MACRLRMWRPVPPGPGGGAGDPRSRSSPAPPGGPGSRMVSPGGGHRWGRPRIRGGEDRGSVTWTHTCVSVQRTATAGIHSSWPLVAGFHTTRTSTAIGVAACGVRSLSGGSGCCRSGACLRRVGRASCCSSRDRAESGVRKPGVDHSRGALDVDHPGAPQVAATGPLDHHTGRLVVVIDRRRNVDPAVPNRRPSGVSVASRCRLPFFRRRACLP
jgi:hypothetical protein